MKILLSHPTGNQFVRALAKALSDEKLLSEFHTTIAIDSNSPLLKLLPDSIKKELLRRTYPIPEGQICTHPLIELARFTLPKLGLKNFVKHETGRASVDAVYRNLDDEVADHIKNTKPDAIYAYEDGAISSFIAAKKLGIECLYDLPIGYWRALRELLKAEQERWPDWAVTLPGFLDSQEKLERKDTELRLADKIFVASSFTKKTLEYFPGDLPPIKVIPYGFPPVNEKRSYSVNLSLTRPLKIIFVGGLSQRKGIADLFEAVKFFGDRVILTVVGNKTTNDCHALNEALSKHNWIPSLPHADILKLMREHDALIFPSLFEGFGLVITEAMAQGTPVITTDRTAGPDIIKEGENGWLIQAGSTEKLISAIENVLMHPTQIANAGKEAMETAKKRPWEVYGQEMLNEIVHN